MIQLRHRQLMIFAALAAALLASVIYDTLMVQERNLVQMLLVAMTAASFGAIFVVQRYPLQLVVAVLVSNWPLHLFTLCFFWIVFAFHNGAMLGQAIVYTLFAYATYLLVPLVFVCDRQIFVAFLKLVALVCVVLAVPAFAGAAGVDQFLGMPLRIKPSYAEFSGIIATAGVLEHPEGFAYQMAIGLFCAIYAARREKGFLFVFCAAVCLLGLVVSQGRAAIYGVCVAAAFALLPQLFRRSPPAFLVTLALFLTFPFFIWPLLGSVPGLSGYLRIERGLSGRDEAWRFAAEVIRERPWTGHGFLASAELTESEREALRTSGFSGAGTTFHNTFITKAVDLGLVGVFVYSLLYFWPLLRVCRSTGDSDEDALLRSMLILILTTSVFRDYNIGGIRSTAMAGSVFLGLANLRHIDARWRREVLPAEVAAQPADRAAAARKVSLGVRRAFG